MFETWKLVYLKPGSTVERRKSFDVAGSALAWVDHRKQDGTRLTFLRVEHPSGDVISLEGR